MVPDFPKLDYDYWERGYHVVAVDEVGRGALAGPLVVCALVLDRNNVPDGINDSKKLSVAARERLDKDIKASALMISIVSAEATEIDASDIRKVTLRSMAKAVEMVIGRLESGPLWLLVDGNEMAPIADGLVAGHDAIVKGDTKSVSIGAASIVAKVYRDAFMRGEAHDKFPEYGFADHMGYGTEKHIATILRLGPCPLHRKTFIGGIQSAHSQILLF